MKQEILNSYSPTEEKLNVYSHLLGLFLSIVGLILLIKKSLIIENRWATVSFIIFGLSMITLYLASTLYHAATNPEKRIKLKIFDHVAIYVLIAGSYTPYTLVSLVNDNGWKVFAIVWGFALIGIIIKLFFTGRFKVVSTLMYVLMGWMIVFSFSDLQKNVSEEGINWLIAGGIAYTVGAILYSIKKIPYNHAIFHVFVLIGTFCHFFSILNYVL
ncbi:PAQR family membrane homeostasis protein TrhA [Faecalibacter macacae]|uniref:Hemolysin III family protein n=1 Tax=Faecalibacter macacae TaxID=1859289 RepID=A0A3L9MF41_9FLAO|nr:hemolysin III family protein [Faecalibacter macacae]RLZ09884.1 hemolysin III family protein [Faecalibacter macacae]